MSSPRCVCMYLDHRQRQTKGANASAAQNNTYIESKFYRERILFSKRACSALQHARTRAPRAHNTHAHDHPQRYSWIRHTCPPTHPPTHQPTLSHTYTHAPPTTTPKSTCKTLRPCGARPGPLSLLRGRLWRPATSPSRPPSPLLTDAPPELVLENLLDLLDSTPENTEQLSMRFRSDEPPPVEEGDQGCSGFSV